MTMPFASGFRVSSPYGTRTDPITGQVDDWHGGVDLVGNDLNVRAVVGGVVVRSRIVTDTSDRTSEWGNYVSILGDDDRQYYYCHLAARAVEVGQRVEEGQIVGIEGMTGKATGVHLHFETRNDSSVRINPCIVLGIPNQVGYIWTPPPAVKLDPWEEQASEWAREAVSWAVERGILKGRGGDDYALGEPVTREELCVMLWRAREVL